MILCLEMFFHYEAYKLRTGQGGEVCGLVDSFKGFPWHPASQHDFRKASGFLNLGLLFHRERMYAARARIDCLLLSRPT